MQERHAHPERGADGRVAPIAPSPALVREALARIMASDAFDAPERNRKFLEYIVEETLSGKEARIKAYSIAIAVFGRDDGFDPQTDPIVRIEASRLRRSLERYYLLAGRDDPLRIEIPKGGYVPTFERRPPAAVDPSPAPEPAPVGDARASTLQTWAFASVGGIVVIAVLLIVWVTGGLSLDGGSTHPADRAGSLPRGPRILVMPFTDDGGSALGERLARGFTREIVVGLTRFGDLRVFDTGTGPPGAPAPAPGSAAAAAGVDFMVQGGVSALAGQFRVSASLVDVASGRHLWSSRLTQALSADDIIAARNEVADRIVGELAQPYGVLFSTKVREIDGKPPEALSSYECVLLFYQYWRQQTAAAFPAVRACLERAIVVDPDYAEGFASLALLYADNYRLGFGERIDDPLGRALVLATRATELAPASAQGHKALSLVYWLMNDVERSFEAAERVLSLNPNDAQMMAELGMRYAMRKEPERGVALLEKAYARNAYLPTIYRIGFFLHHYLEGRFVEALAEAKRIGTPDVVYGHICRVMAAAQLARSAEATAALAQLTALRPGYGADVVADLENRNVHPEIIGMAIADLEKAGLEVTSDRRPEALRAGSNAGGSDGKVP